MGFGAWLKNAFAVEPPGPAEPNDRQREIVERVGTEIVRRGLTTPALLLLETCRPLNFVSAQAMHFFVPIVSALADASGCREFALFLEQRGSVAYLCDRLEHLSGTADHQQRPPLKSEPTLLSK